MNIQENIIKNADIAYTDGNSDMISENGTLKCDSEKSDCFNHIGYWESGYESDIKEPDSLKDVMLDIRKPFYVISEKGTPKIARGEAGITGKSESINGSMPVVAYIPACRLENLGNIDFLKCFNIKYPYIAGSMAQGISSVEITEKMADAGMLGFFGAAGLSLAQIESAIEKISERIKKDSYGFNMIHSPYEPEFEKATAELYIKKRIHLIEASAFLDITPSLVKYRIHDIKRSSNGEIITPNHIIAKVSRVELASKFFSPPPLEMVKELVNAGFITEEQAKLSQFIPLAQDVTAEADSGGHTDNRPAITLIPTIMAVKDEIQKKYKYDKALRVGAAGGISTPASAAAAFSMGAAYIMTGSVNQACIEAGTSDIVKNILAKTEQADITMAPAADMFEMGIKIQVLKRGTMFPMRAAKLFNLYTVYNKIDDLPENEKLMLEKNLFRASFDEIWNQTYEYFIERDIKQIELAKKDPRHKMALLFRYYLGQSSKWAVFGDSSRIVDYQIWCGPSMGAFNEWTKGTFLQEPSARNVKTVAMNILFGAAVIMRLNCLKMQGMNRLFPSISDGTLNPAPLEDDVLNNFLM